MKTPPSEKMISAFLELSLMTEKLTITLELTPLEICKLAGTMQLAVPKITQDAKDNDNDVNLNHTAAVLHRTQGIMLEQALKAHPRLLELCEEIGMGSVSA